jgi:hypothetical protein
MSSSMYRRGGVLVRLVAGQSWKFVVLLPALSAMTDSTRERIAVLPLVPMIVATAAIFIIRRRVRRRTSPNEGRSSS